MLHFVSMRTRCGAGTTLNTEANTFATGDGTNLIDKSISPSSSFHQTSSLADKLPPVSWVEFVWMITQNTNPEGVKNNPLSQNNLANNCFIHSY
jgi:hypothetical protein